MADITKCLTKDCPLASNCFRQTANEGFKPSYAKFEFEWDSEAPSDAGPGETSFVKCYNYLPITTDEKL